MPPLIPDTIPTAAELPPRLAEHPHDTARAQRADLGCAGWR
ncbi:hypothetical protein ACFU99_14000 [Streptomyces sp. NPDC057654]